MGTSDEPRVFLVGAGPGDPGLLTVRAVELLATADWILYDQLVPKRILEVVNPRAEQVCVRDLPGQNPDKYPHIFQTIIDAALAGKRVVRLKGGDPLIFGRGGEEAEMLRNSGLAYEIVPGVTAALAAAAYLDIPLTHRHQASAVAFITGHELPAKPGNKLDWQALANFPGTLVIYMGIARLPLIVAELLKFGKDPNTPSAIVERASTGDMRSTFSPMHNLEQARRAAGMESPGLILIGPVIDLRAARSWFEQKPLFGKRVLVTRPKAQAEPMMRRIEHLGGVPVHFPTIDIREPDDLSALDASIEQLVSDAFDWLVFTSANGVQSLFNRIHHLGKDARVLGRTRIAAIGTKTAEALHELRLQPDLVPSKSVRSEGFLEALREPLQGKRVLLARAEQGRDVLRAELSQIAEVSQVVVYKQVETLDPEAEPVMALRRGEISFVALSSSNIAKCFASILDETILGRIERHEIQLVGISQEVAEVFQEFRVPCHTATMHTSEGMIEEMVRLARQAGSVN
jgi:uroporphyrinogen III methyltransferase / synthase